MTIRKIALALTALSLAGCASVSGPASDSTSSIQSAVYRVDDSKKTAMAQNGADMTPGESKPLRIYWFLGDR